MKNLKLKNKTKKVVLTKNGSVNKSVLNMLRNCTFESNNRIIRTGYYSGSGRFTSRHTAMHTVTNILNCQGYKHEVGNDSPRGGATGEFVKVSKVAFDFLYNLKEYAK